MMRRYELLALAGALSVSSSLSALAQIASSADVIELEVLTVTATKTERSASEVPEHALTRDAPLCAYGVEVDVLPGPLGWFLYPRTAVGVV